MMAPRPIIGIKVFAVVTAMALASGAHAALTNKGSRICNSTRTALAAIDASYTLTDNNDKII